MQRFALLKIATEVQKVVHTALRFARRACEVVQIFWPKWNATGASLSLLQHHGGVAYKVCQRSVSKRCLQL